MFENKDYPVHRSSANPKPALLQVPEKLIVFYTHLSSYIHLFIRILIKIQFVIEYLNKVFQGSSEHQQRRRIKKIYK